MSLKRKIFDAGFMALDPVWRILGSGTKAVIYSRFLEEKTPIETIKTPCGDIKFFCPGKICIWRARTLLTKEPETIQWITKFEENAVFWDIGANVGCYSLYASYRNIHVLSFEPSAINYYVLNKNIEINGLDGQIVAYCLAFSDQSSVGLLNLSNMTAGGAINSFGERQDKVFCGGYSSGVNFRQGMIGLSVDDFITKYGMPIPNYIKIDVDGLEDKIIEGAKDTLKSVKVKSLLIELDSDDVDYCMRVIRILETCGLCLVSKRHAPMFDSGKFSSIFNYIFERQ